MILTLSHHRDAEEHALYESLVRVQQRRHRVPHPNVLPDAGCAREPKGLVDEHDGRMGAVVVVLVKQLRTRHLVVLTDAGAVEVLRDAHEAFDGVRVGGAPHVRLRVAFRERRPVRGSPSRLRTARVHGDVVHAPPGPLSTVVEWVRRSDRDVPQFERAVAVDGAEEAAHDGRIGHGRGDAAARHVQHSHDSFGGVRWIEEPRLLRPWFEAKLVLRVFVHEGHLAHGTDRDSKVGLRFEGAQTVGEAHPLLSSVVFFYSPRYQGQ